MEPENYMWTVEHGKHVRIQSLPIRLLEKLHVNLSPDTSTSHEIPKSRNLHLYTRTVLSSSTIKSSSSTYYPHLQVHQTRVQKLQKVAERPRHPSR
jgi:hypothetical protein